MSQMDNSTTNANTLSEMNVQKSNKKHKSDKTKKTDDNVVESGMGATLPDGTSDNLPATKKNAWDSLPTESQ